MPQFEAAASRFCRCKAYFLQLQMRACNCKTCALQHQLYCCSIKKEEAKGSIAATKPHHVFAVAKLVANLRLQKQTWRESSKPALVQLQIYVAAKKGGGEAVLSLQS